MDPSTSSSSSSSMFMAAGMPPPPSSSAHQPTEFMNLGEGSSSQQQLQNPPQRQPEDSELCLVCNDVATGYHYGTPSCNGCKTFFRRTVMKKQVFQCQYDGNCPVDKSVRCACRHCRFKKCLAVGMNKDAIQQNRDPIGYTKRTRRYPLVKQQHVALLGSGFGCPSTSSTPFPGSIAPSPFPGSSSMAGPSSSASFMGSSSTLSSSMNPLGAGTSSNFGGSATASASRASVQQQQQQQQPVSTEQVQEDILLQRLIGVENILITIRNSKVTMQKSLNDLVLNRSVFEDPSLLKKMSTESFQMPNVLRRAEQEDYLYWHERDWFIMIEWAKMLPVYQQLSTSDKLALLRHSAITYPSLIQCFYTPDVGPDTIVFPNGAFFDRTLDPNKPTGFQRKNFKMLDNLLNPIRKMQIDQNEFAGAKAVFFLNPGNFEDDSDADDLSSEAKGRIAVARSAITNALYRYMVHKRGTEEAADKFGKLLLLGTAIATMSCEMKEAVVVADFFDQIRFSGFARQLLLAKDEDDLSTVSMGTVQPYQNASQDARQMQHQQQQQQQFQQQQQQQLFTSLAPTTASAVTNNAAVTMAMLNGLNAQMQQIQQQQQQTLPNLDFAELVGQHAPMMAPMSDQEREKLQQRQQMIQQLMAVGQQQQQQQYQFQQFQLGQTQLNQIHFGQTQLGQTQLCKIQIHQQSNPGQTVLPPQDQPSPAGLQPPSAQSVQSFTNTSPPSLESGEEGRSILINLT